MSESKVGSDAPQVTHDCCAVPGTVRKERLATPEGRWVGDKKPQIQLLYFDKYPTYKQALQILSEVLAATGVSGEVREVNVTSAAKAHQLKFIGSPTIRIDGRDLDPVPPGEQYGLKCRVYSVDGRLAGCPSREMVLAALKEAGYVA